VCSTTSQKKHLTDYIASDLPRQLHRNNSTIYWMEIDLLSWTSKAIVNKGAMKSQDNVSLPTKAREW